MRPRGDCGMPLAPSPPATRVTRRRHLPPAWCSVAIKIISKKVFKKPEDRADMLREVDIMNRVKGHANVTNLVAQMEDKDRFVVVMELADGGDVMSRIEELLQADKHFTEALASSYFKQMLEGVKHCHDKLVVHR